MNDSKFLVQLEEIVNLIESGQAEGQQCVAMLKSVIREFKGSFSTKEFNRPEPDNKEDSEFLLDLSTRLERTLASNIKGLINDHILSVINGADEESVIIRRNVVQEMMKRLCNDQESTDDLKSFAKAHADRLKPVTLENQVAKDVFGKQFRVETFHLTDDDLNAQTFALDQKSLIYSEQLLDMASRIQKEYHRLLDVRDYGVRYYDRERQPFLEKMLQSRFPLFYHAYTEKISSILNSIGVPFLWLDPTVPVQLAKDTGHFFKIAEETLKIRRQHVEDLCVNQGKSILSTEVEDRIKPNNDAAQKYLASLKEHFHFTGYKFASIQTDPESWPKPEKPKEEPITYIDPEDFVSTTINNPIKSSDRKKASSDQTYRGTYTVYDESPSIENSTD